MPLHCIHFFNWTMLKTKNDVDWRLYNAIQTQIYETEYSSLTRVLGLTSEQQQSGADSAWQSGWAGINK